MNILENKITQFIALVGIIGTLAGFGYTGATYVNRLENLEGKIGGVKEADEGLQEIEERFVAIETSVQFINKSIDESLVARLDRNADNLKVIDEGLTSIKTDIATLKADVKNLKEDTEGNPLAD